MGPHVCQKTGFKGKLSLEKPTHDKIQKASVAFLLDPIFTSILHYVNATYCT